MDHFSILKIVHGTTVFLFFITLIFQSLILFKTKLQDISNLPYRRVFMALQHSLFTILLVTGGSLLYLKNFQVEHWFYAKIILFIVLISSVIKAFKRQRSQQILLVQRKGGMVLAWIAFIAILFLVKFKPALF